MENEKPKARRGGFRPGAGRKPSGRTAFLGVNITPEALFELDTMRGPTSRGEFVDRLIKKKFTFV